MDRIATHHRPLRHPLASGAASPHAPRPRDACRDQRPSRLAVPAGLFLLAALLLLGACAELTSTPPRGGVPARQAAQLSLAVAQTRSQFPQLSGAAIPYALRKAPQGAAARAPELALRGEGVGVEPGLQLAEPPRVQAALYLAKPGYARGYLEVTPAGKPAQRWRIVAFDLRGAPQYTFDFTYVLATPANEVRYLVLLGGGYEQDGVGYLGYEGTLIEPGPGGDLEHWTRAFKLDFGYKLPEVPAHQTKVAEADKLFRALQGDVEHLGRLAESIAAGAAKLAALRAAAPDAAPGSGAGTGSAGAPGAGATGAAAAVGVTPAPAGGAAPADKAAAERERQIAETRSSLETMRSERAALLGTAQQRFVRYYDLRKAIAEEYAAFTDSNRYLWLDTSGRQGFYDRWKVVESHHPRIDELAGAYTAANKEQAPPVLAARKAAMAAIGQADNWSRNPAQAAGAKPRR